MKEKKSTVVSEPGAAWGPGGGGLCSSLVTLSSGGEGTLGVFVWNSEPFPPWWGSAGVIVQSVGSSPWVSYAREESSPRASAQDRETEMPGDETFTL